MSLTATSEKANGEPEPLRLHPNGDVLLILESPDRQSQRRIIASSHILSLASNYCSKILGLNNKTSPDGRKPFVLEDDDAEATEIVLSLLHFKGDKYKTLSPMMLARVSKQCQKYECTDALDMKFDSWMQNMPLHEPNVQPMVFAQNLGYMILSAFLFQREDCFRGITRDAVRYLPSNFQQAWIKNKIIAALPKEVLRGISDEIYNRLSRVHIEIQMTQTNLQHDISSFHMVRNAISQFTPCNAPTRVSNYFEVLRQNGLWPTASVFAQCQNPTLEGVMKKLDTVVAAVQQYHVCSGGTNCPFAQQVTALHQRCKEISYTFVGLDVKGFGPPSPTIEAGVEESRDSIVVAASAQPRKRRMVEASVEE